MASKTCNCIVFYDLKASNPNLELWYNQIMEWLQENNQVPKRMGLSGESIKKSERTKTFKHYDKVLRDGKFKNINYIWIGATSSNINIEDDNDSLFTIELRLCEPFTSLVFCFDDSILPFNRGHLETFGQKMASYFDARYGIGYQREFKKGPGWYAFGVIQGIPRKPEFEYERSLISKWFHSYGKDDYKLGDLRDVYPINFLSSHHLDRQVYGQPLKEWILSSSDHGGLKQLDQTLWLWYMPEDKVSFIRDKLKTTGILLCA